MVHSKLFNGSNRIGQVFGNGNGRLGVETRDEVIRRNEARKDKEAAVVLRKKTKLRGLISSAIVILDKMKNKTYKLNGKELHVLVRYKHAKGDKKIPSSVAEIRVWWNETRDRQREQATAAVATT